MEKCFKKHCFDVKHDGSFKGYTRVDTVNTVGYPNESPTQNKKWNPNCKVGLIAGFAVFAVAYLITVVYIFIDINKRGKMYDDMIVEDLSKLQ